MSNANLMKCLLEAGAYVDIKDSEGRRPLHYASAAGKPELVALLLQYNSSAYDQDDKGETPLHLSCQHGHVLVTFLLLKNHTNLLLYRNKEHKTALDLACEFGHTQVVELLLQLDPNGHCRSLLLNSCQDKADNDRTTCLHLAARNGHLDVIRLLLNAGMDINRETLQGTALQEAAFHGKLEVVNLLLEYPRGFDVKKLNSYNQTALDTIRSVTMCHYEKKMMHLLKEVGHTMLEDQGINMCPSPGDSSASGDSFRHSMSSVDSGCASGSDKVMPAKPHVLPQHGHPEVPPHSSHSSTSSISSDEILSANVAEMVLQGLPEKSTITMSSGGAVPPEVSDGGSYKCQIEHKVSNFSTLPVNEDHFSPYLFSPEQPDFKWCIGFSITEVRAEKRFLAYLKPCFPASTLSCFFHYTLSVQNSNGRRLSEYSATSDITSDHVPSRTYHHLLFADDIGAIPDDNLTLEAAVTFVLAQAGSVGVNCLQFAHAGDELLADLSGMLGTDLFSDVVLSVVMGSGEPVTLPAHCFLLASRSSYFRRKLTGDTPESRDRVIRITDIDVDTVRRMMAYIYTDRFDDSLGTNDVLMLLKCSKNYLISGLKSLCEMHLIRNINNDTAFKCLIAGDRYDAKELKARSLEIICNSRANMARIKDALNEMDNVSQEEKLRLLMEISYQASMNFLPK